MLLQRKKKNNLNFKIFENLSGDSLTRSLGIIFRLFFDNNRNYLWWMGGRNVIGGEGIKRWGGLWLAGHWDPLKLDHDGSYYQDFMHEFNARDAKLKNEFFRSFTMTIINIYDYV